MRCFFSPFIQNYINTRREDPELEEWLDGKEMEVCRSWDGGEGNHSDIMTATGASGRWPACITHVFRWLAGQASLQSVPLGGEGGSERGHKTDTTFLFLYLLALCSWGYCSGKKDPFLQSWSQGTKFLPFLCMFSFQPERQRLFLQT